MLRKIKIGLFIILFLWLWVKEVFWDYSVFDKKVNKYCEFYGKWFKQSEIKRCKGAGKAQMRFENWKVWNNLYNFKSINVKTEWKKYWVIWIKKNFLLFKDKSSSIAFFAQRFYKFDYRKTTKQLVSGWCYYNLKKKYVCFDWFTLSWTKQEHSNYIGFIDSFIKKES